MASIKLSEGWGIPWIGAKSPERPPMCADETAMRPGRRGAFVKLSKSFGQVFLLLAVFASSVQAAVPTVTGMNKTGGRPGTVVQITGSELTGIHSVTFNGVSARFRELSPKLMTSVVPDGATDGSILITTSQGSVEAGYFDVHLGPEVISTSASNVVVGDEVSITGKNLLSVTAVKLASQATPDGIPADFNVISDSQLNFMVPEGGPNNGYIRLESPYGNANAGRISVNPAPLLQAPPEAAICGDGFCAVGEDVSCPSDCNAQASCGGISDPADVRISDEVDYTFVYDNETFTRKARLYAPQAGTQSGVCPMVVVLPGGCMDKESAEWTGPLLASRGYVVLVAEVEAPLASGGAGARNVQVCSAAAQGAMDFMQSTGNPFLSDSDTTRIGGAGYSLGARTWVKTQEVDSRVGAIVAWDNLATSEDGDVGSPACVNEPGVIRQPRVPAMGQASELSCVQEPDRAGHGIDAKKNGFLHWRQAGMPSMQLTIRNVGHGAWSGQESNLRPVFAYYTTNWFDRFLKGDMNATQRLMSRHIPVGEAGQDVGPLFSGLWRSAAYLDGYDCPDFGAACAPAGEVVQWAAAAAGGGPGVDYSRGAACDTAGRCVASGDLHNVEGVFGEYQVQFGDRSVTVEALPEAPIASYVWGFSPKGQPEEPVIVPGFASVDVDMQSDGTAVIAGRQFADQQTLMGPLVSQTGTMDAAWLGLGKSGQIRYGAVFGSGAVDTINEVAVAGDDSVVVTGPFGQSGSRRDLQFPDGSGVPFTGGDQDVFVAKFSPTGAFQWGMGLYGDGHEEGRGVSVLPTGDVILCGEFDGQLQLGSSTYRAVNGSPDVFVALLDGDTGNVKWSRRFGAGAREVCRGVDPGQDGEIVMSGEYVSLLDLDGIALKAHAAEDQDIFIARLRSSDGAVLSAQSLGSAGDDVGCELERGEDDTIWCAGSASQGVDYPGGYMGTSGDQFLLRFTPSLSHVEQALSFKGDEGTSLNFAIGLAPGNRGMVVGSMAGTTGVHPRDITAPYGADDFFVARFGPGTASQ
jgi:dienelactone hydrolase